MAKAFEFKAFENLYEGETETGKLVRCNKDDFASIAAECEEAGIELTPDLAIAEGYPGFYIVERAWGGKRDGAGRKMGSQYLKAANWVEASQFWMYAYEFTTQAAAFNASLKMEKVLRVPFQVRKVEEGVFAVITQYNPLSRV